MDRNPRSIRTFAISGSLVVVLLAAGFTMAVLARSGTTIGDLGLAVFGGAVVGGVFVVIEYQLNLANQRRHDHDSLLLQLTSTSDLAGIDLSDYDLSGAYLPGKKLVAARLDRTKLIGAKMFFADLRHASMRSIDMTGCDLGGSILEEADIEGGILVSVDLYDSNVRNANLRGADLSHAAIVRADLSGSDFRGASLANATIENTSLLGTDFRDADLEGTVFKRVQYDSNTMWPFGFSPPPNVASDTTSTAGATLTEWLSLRRDDRGRNRS